MLSINLLGCFQKSIAGIPFALFCTTYKIGFPGWPEPNLDSVTGFGASIEKRGLAPAPFSISQADSGHTSKWWLAKSTRERPWFLQPGLFCALKK
jgi:hypothetical protein